MAVCREYAAALAAGFAHVAYDVWMAALENSRSIYSDGRIAEKKAVLTPHFVVDIRDPIVLKLLLCSSRTERQCCPVYVPLCVTTFARAQALPILRQPRPAEERGT